ncbi:UNKNOWN [Stylonychia lemnae]|uniref:Uncharacterized protein n=1 Tax=Stylonychia lemnae TaxID=5949 RepID=A0A078A5H7_STYLE|nr:UNKNOWN [Stylonychia lemnae]|eukprot:CDW76009.1 UNKNOWN [Stylonychia lemnae]
MDVKITQTHKTALMLRLNHCERLSLKSKGKESKLSLSTILGAGGKMLERFQLWVLQVHTEGKFQYQEQSSIHYPMSLISFIQQKTQNKFFKSSSYLNEKSHNF